MDSKASSLEITDPELLQRLPKPKKPKRKPRKPFHAKWVQFPRSWIEALRRAKSAGTTYELALTILSENFKREYGGGSEVALSRGTTKMSRRVRRRATKELVKLGLIKLHRESGNQAFRVTIIIKE
jgi:hypothetical protein